MGVVGDFLFGDGQGGSQTSVPKITDQEQNRANEIEGGINDAFEHGVLFNPEINDMVKKHAIDFLTKGGAATPEDIATATNYVDSIFTNPAKNALAQRQSDFSDSSNARAAALGRNPNMDIATQQAIFGEGLRGQNALESERASRIDSTVNNNFSRDMQNKQAGLGSATFLNQLTQQAFGNRMSLLNAKSGLNQYYQADRFANSNTQTQAPNAGLLGNAAGVIGVAQGGQKAGAQLGAQITGSKPAGLTGSSGLGEY